MTLTCWFFRRASEGFTFARYDKIDSKGEVMNIFSWRERWFCQKSFLYAVLCLLGISVFCPAQAAAQKPEIVWTAQERPIYDQIKNLRRSAR